MMLPVLYKNKKLLWLQPGDVVLFRSDFVPYIPLRYVSAGVRGFTGVNLNHAGQIVSSWGRLMINEAKGSGVIARPLEYYLERYKTSIVILRPKKAIVEKEFCIKANDKLGTHYDLASLLIHQAWYRITGEWIGKTGPAADNAMECAEYVAWCHGRPDPYLYSVRELLLDDYFEIIYEEIPIKIKNPPMESLPPAGNHIQGACYG
ncbi:MAG: hypothetical protein ACJ748_01660, partial [Flavisolibacter sp.]